MSSLRQRIEPLRSRKVMESARGQPCTLEFEVCNNDPETTVSCHIHDDHFGMAMKADDTSTVHGCSECHRYMDQGGWIGRISQTVLLRHILRAMQRTLRNRIDRGIIIVPLDPERLHHDKPIKPRPPSDKRKKIVGRTEIQSRGFGEQHRPMRGRNLKQEKH